MFKRIFQIILWLIAVFLLTASFGFSYIESRKLICRDIKIAIIDSAKIRFLGSTDIERWVKSNYGSIIGKSINSVNLRRIEEGLRKINAIESVAVYTNVFENGVKKEGSLVVRIRQRKPVCRVIGSGRTYYIDRYGEKINWSPRFTPRVIIVGGNFSIDYAKKRLLPLVEYINDNWFWSAQIDQIYVNPNGELTLIPRVGDQTIIFGSPEDYLIKFRNLKGLYADGFKNGGWTTYKTINTKYLNQIVCTKK